MLRKGLIGLGILVFLALAGALAVRFLVDPELYRDTIERHAKDMLGRPVELGELSLSWFPFGVGVAELEIGALPNEGVDHLLTADDLTVGARLLPLLSKRLEVTAVTVRGASLHVVRNADGRWNLEALLADPSQPSAGSTAGGGSAASIRDLRLVRGRITVVDRSVTPATTTTLEELELRMTDLAADRPVTIDGNARVAEYGADLRVSGRVGPLAAEEVLVNLVLGWENLDLARLGAPLPGTRASGEARIQGSVPGDTTAAGRLALDSPRAEIAYDVALARGGETVSIRETRIDLDGDELRLTGEIRDQDGRPHADIVLEPATLPAAKLVSLAALGGVELPFALSSPEPVRLAGRFVGPLDEDPASALEASVTVRSLRLEHPSLTSPMERVEAKVSLAADRLEVRAFRGEIGGSDLAGSIALRGFAKPAVTVDLRSRRADIGALLSLLEVEGGEPTGGPEGPADEFDLTVAGTLRIDEGTFDTLDFRDLRAELDYRDDVVALDPASLSLYGGTFRGSVRADLSRDPVTFALDGAADAVDVDGFSADNLDVRGLLLGKLAGRISTRGAGADYETIVRNLQGDGNVTIDDGRLGPLNVLETVSKAAGVFGAKSVARLGSQLSAEGTEFQKMAGSIGFEGGKLQVADLEVVAADFALGGSCRLGLLDGRLDGRFRLRFSEAVSAAMREEASRVAELFYEPRSGRVELPFTLEGPLESPRPGIDFDAVAKNKLGSLIEDKLGLREPGAAPDAAVVTTDLPDVEIRFGAPRWRGPVLARDLELSGTVSAPEGAVVKLAVADPDGRVRERVETLPLQDGAFRVKLDGKRLIGGSAFSATVTVTLPSGESEVATLRIER